MFPTKLVKQCLKCGCPKDGLVLDPFAGSGTTGMVAKQNGRDFVLIELSPDYVKICEQRCNGVSAKE